LGATGAPEAGPIYEELQGQSEPAYIRRSAFAALLRLDKDQGEARILKVLHSSDPVLKPVAIAAIGSLRSADASERFATELPKLPPDQQVWLIASLEARGDKDARSAIGRSLALPDASARRAAIAALGRLGDSSSVSLLAQALANWTEVEDQRILESALIDLGGGAATDQAIAAELKKSSRPARTHLIAALARRQGPAACPLLFEETANTDPKVARAAFRALGRTAQPADAPALLTKVIQQQDPGLRAEAESTTTQVLGRIEDADRRSALVLEALRSANDPEARSGLLSLLPVCGDAKSLAALKAAATEPNPQIREAAIRGLADWPDATAWDSLIAVYRQPENELLRGLALRGLVRLAGEENAHADAKLVERYMQLLSGAHSDGDLKLILGALSGAANPDALQLALPLLSNSGIRPEAELAVKKIAQSIKTKYPDAAQSALQKLEAR
jgi:HEAT repeat protein